MAKNESSCIDVYKEKKLIGSVCVAVAKEPNKRDILFMDKEGDTFSVRSTTELMNLLTKLKITFEDRKEILNFVGERLRILEFNK